MSRLNKIFFGTLFLLSSSFTFACDYPVRPSIPDGSAASKDQLIAAKNEVQDFMAKVDEYLLCIETEEKAAVEAMDNPSEEERQRRNAMVDKKFDAANEEKALLGEQFNQQIRAYNQKLQESKE